MTDAAVRRASSTRVWFLWLTWFAILAALTAFLLLFRSRLDKAHVTLAFLLVVLGGSSAGGRVLGITLSVGAFLSFNYFFLPPYGTLVIADPLDWLVLVAFLLVSVVAAQLLYRATTTAEAATQRAAEVDRLATLGAETLNLPSPQDALGAILGVIRSTLNVVACSVYVRSENATVTRAAHATARADAAETADDTSRAESTGLVAWIFEHGQGAVELADGTVRLLTHHVGMSERGVRASLASMGSGDARALALPLTVRGETVGVLRIEAEQTLALSAEQARFVDALAYYAALGVERGRLVAEAERAEAERRVESLRSALLTAVSHDLRTPLTTIKGIAHEIADGKSPARARIIESEVDHLNALIGDLLELSRIHAGALQPDVALNTVDELVGAALRRSQGALADRPVEVDLGANELLTGRFDLAQSLRALVNLLENAAKYSPPAAPLLVRARRAGSKLRISVLDRGPGIPPSERERIFEPFYRPRGTPPDVRGTGLGLSIARGLALAQGGSVEYEPRVGGGSAFTLVLPAMVHAPNDAALSEALPEPH